MVNYNYSDNPSHDINSYLDEQEKAQRLQEKEFCGLFDDKDVFDNFLRDFADDHANVIEELYGMVTGCKSDREKVGDFLLGYFKKSCLYKVKNGK